jgi:hypothetical protein
MSPPYKDHIPRPITKSTNKIMTFVKLPLVPFNNEILTKNIPSIKITDTEIM